MQYVLHCIIYIISYIFLLNPTRGDVTTQINRIVHDTLATPNAVQTWHATAHFANSLSAVYCNKPRPNHFFPAQIQSSQPQKERDAVDCVPFFSSHPSIHFDESVSMKMHTAHFAYDHAPSCMVKVHGQGVGVAVLVGVRETATPLFWSPNTITRPLRSPRMVFA